jgi:tetratricopeptide (TPR) repeat protein
LTREEMRAYTAGIVEVVEQATRTVHEGDTTVVRVDVEVKIDTAAVAGQIAFLRKSEETKDELKKLQEEAESLRQQLRAKTSELQAQRTKEGVDKIAAQRRQIIDRALANDLAERATTLWLDFVLADWTAEAERKKPYSTTSMQYLARGREVAERALAVDSVNVGAQRVMARILISDGRCNLTLGDNKAGLARLREAVRLDPTSAYANSTLASALGKMGDHSGAIAEQDIAIAIKPDDALGHVGLGNLLLLKGDVDGAILEYRRGIELDGNEPHGHIGLSMALKKKGLEEEGQRELCRGMLIFRRMGLSTDREIAAFCGSP